MTGQPELQQTLIPLAEKAGEKLWQDHGMCPKGHDVDNCTKNWIVFATGSRVPGRDGTLRLEDVGLVLGWLAKAKFFVTTGFYPDLGDNFEVVQGTSHVRITGAVGFKA